MKTPREIKNLYDQGENIKAILRKDGKTQVNSEAMIEISYDIQAGSYIESMKAPEKQAFQEKYTKEIANVISSLCAPRTIMEAGVGEATTLSGVCRNLHSKTLEPYGFDLCWSRVAYARQWMERQGILNSRLCTGSLFQIPAHDNSIDVVYTAHSIESNTGREEPILKELYRVANQYLVLLEPHYEHASPEAQKRMHSFGICTDIYKTCINLGFKVLRHELFAHINNPLHPTTLTVIEKKAGAEKLPDAFACPKYKTPLQYIGGMYFSPEAMTVYPVLAGIPCLRVENGIIASKFPEFEEMRSRSFQEFMIPQHCI
jgi:ubiquinone/menaquinone biosynthesis C-methylase UbiE/uncharacterized protein YbaR (Trm112 family)